MKRKALVVLGWLLAVAAATAVGLTAVSLLSEGLTIESTTSLNHDAVAQALASSTSAPHPTSASPKAPTPQPTSTPTSDSTRPLNKTVTKSFSSDGGTVIARCTGNTAYLVAWTPAQGFGVDKYVRGPAESTLVEFDGDADNVDDVEITITVTCEAGKPIVAIVQTDD